ncbi:MAG: MBL fold metallo-hydrolase [Kofleriaceae bacterium]
MFGNAPKAMWSRWIAPDDDNRIPLACRCFLVRDGERTILLETGIGAFFAPALRQRFGVVEDHHVLLDGLAALGIAPEDVDVVVLSRTCADRAGGLSAWRDGEAPSLVFPRATFVVGAEAWARAQARTRDPRPRSSPSWRRCCRPRVGSGSSTAIARRPWAKATALHRSEGHTPGLVLATEIAMPDGPLLFASDLIPGRAWVHLPTDGLRPLHELLIEEKSALLGELFGRQGRLPVHARRRDRLRHDRPRRSAARYHTVDRRATLVDLAA